MNVLALLFCCVSAYGSQVTPVQKVIQLMEGMLEKGKKEKHGEQVQFAAYKQFCDDTTVEKSRAIAEANEQIDTLKADIQKYSADAAKLTKEIAGLDEDISIWEGDIKAATNVREIEKNDYDTMHKDLSESVDALGRAIAVLKKQTGDKKQAFLQLSSLTSLKLMTEESKKTINLFLDQDSDDEGLAVSAPEANAYEFQSSGVVEMLEKLNDKFIDERTAAEKEEMNSKHAFDMLMQDLNAQIAQASQDRDEKATSKAKKLQAKADATGDLKDTTTTRDADQKYLADLTATCEQKASDFESRQQLRSEEIEAINKAVEIISSGAVSGSADKHLPSLLQTKASAFAQLRSDMNMQAKVKVVSYLKKMAKQLNSRVLSTLAVHAEEDPFSKVKKMIKDLIVRLMEESNEEAEHKGWCDTELGTNEQTRKEKTDSVETLHSEIDSLNSSITKLTESVSNLNEQIAESDT